MLPAKRKKADNNSTVPIANVSSSSIEVDTLWRLRDNFGDLNIICDEEKVVKCSKIVLAARFPSMADNLTSAGNDCCTINKKYR